MGTRAQYFTLNGLHQEKIGNHEGLFTQSYQKVRAIYDAQIRSWAIEYSDNLFYVTDSKEVTEKVYFDPFIKNCSCSSFIENQSGTCMHIEAIRRLNIKPKDLPNVRPIVFLNEEFKLKRIGDENHYFTPAIKPFLQMLKKQNLSFDDRELSEEELNSFINFGITPFSFQKESVRLMIRNKRSMLVLPMGLGKTLCALTCCKILGRKKIIVVCPNSLKFQWQDEINRFKLGSSLVILKWTDIKRYTNHKFLIISYEMLNRNPEILDNNFDIAITDEIQKIKNVESVSWNTLSRLKSEFIFALSGTPIQNNINDLFSLISFLNPYEIKPHWKFYEEYCNFTRAKMYGLLPGKVNELKKRFERYIINPAIDKDSLKLPKQKKHNIYTALSEEQNVLHNSYLDRAKGLIAKSINYPLTSVERIRLNSLLTLARMSVTDARLVKPGSRESSRIREIKKQIDKIVKKGEKVVVYSEWIKSLEFIEAYLIKHDVKYAVFNGSLSAKARNKELHKFLEDETVKVFLSTDSGGSGIDGLQFVCHNIIHIEKLWNPTKIDQRNGRLVRTLQKNDYVNIFEFHSGSDIERMIEENSERKYAIIFDMLR